MLDPQWEKPASWSRFVAAVRSRAPECPLPPEPPPSLARDRLEIQEQIAQAAGYWNTFAGEVGLPEIPVLQMVEFSAAGLANQALDEAVSRGMTRALGATAAGIVGQGVSILRNSYQSLFRADAMVEYLLATKGYVTTLARVAAQEIGRERPRASLPMPLITPQANSLGDLYSATRRGWYEQGCWRVNSVIQDCDLLRPAEGPAYSVLCFQALAFREYEAIRSADLSAKIEVDIYKNFLQGPLTDVRNRLRRWCRS